MQDFEDGGVVDELDQGGRAQEELNDTRKRNVGNLVSNPKTRPKVIFTVVALAFFAAVGAITLMSGNNKAKDDSEVRIAKPNIRANEKVTLNAESSQAYNDLKLHDNEIKSEEAIRAGGAHIEIPVGGVKKEAVSEPVMQPKTEIVNQNTFGNNAPPVQVAYTRDVGYDKGMQSQYEAILAGFDSKPPRTTVIQAVQNTNTTPNTAATSLAAAVSTTPVATTNATDNYDFIVKAGQLALGTVDLEANSDEPGEILATVHTGKLKGAKAICNFTKGKEALTLRCPLISPPWGDQSYAANILLIDPDTNKKDMASDVDHHYFERYAFLLASSFVQGLGEAAARANSVTSTSPLGSTQTQDKLDASSTLLVAAGRAGATASQELQKRSDVQTTVKLYANQSVGFLFLADFKAKSAEQSKQP